MELPGTPPHLYGMLPEDLAAHLRGQGVEVRDGEARRVLAHAITQGRDGYPTSRPVPKRVAEAIDRVVDRRPLEIVERAIDPSDQFVKYLFRLHDGGLAEAVLIPLEVPGRFSICISSQVGCGMACAFCATGRLGLTRNLEPWEILAQYVAIKREAPGEIHGVLFQGQGEPLHNYTNVMRAAEILSHPCGGRVEAKSITISTVGLVPGILRMAEDKPPYRLIVSLTSAIDEKRRSLIPVAAKWSVKEVADAVRTYQRAAGGRARVAWVLLGGINSGADEIAALAHHFHGVPLRLNLIDVNDVRPDGFRRASDEELNFFRDELRRLDVAVVRRYSGGAAKHAACGMLASMQTA